ncbi:MAG: ABC transporter permease, partial [Beijerinckiaceae bacterium]
MSGLAIHASSAGRQKSRIVEKFRRNRGALLGGAIVLFFVACAIFAPLIAPYDP